jgi:hypothetical protein
MALAAIAVNNNGRAVHITELTDGPTGTVVRFFMLTDGTGLLLRTNRDGRLEWLIAHVDGSEIPVPTSRPITLFQSPWSQAPICPGIAAVADGARLKIVVFGTAVLENAVSVLQGLAGFIGDIAVTPRAIAARLINDPSQGLTSVCVVCPATGEVIHRTPLTKLGLGPPLYALSRDGRYLLVFERYLLAPDRWSTRGVCTRLPEGDKCWTINDSALHVLPCGESDFVVRIAGVVQVLAGADGSVLWTLCDYRLHGDLFALSPSGNMLVHENLQIVHFYSK